MRKNVRFQPVLFALILAMILASCSSSAPAANTASSSPGATKAAAVNAPTVESKIGKDFDEIIKKIKAGENKLVWWGSNPGEKPMEELEKEFNKRFGLNIKVERVPIHPDDMPAKLFAEIQAKKMSVDALGTSEGGFLELLKAGVSAKVNWVELFGKELKGIEEASKGVVKEYDGHALEWRHLVYVLGYNTKKLTKDQLPKKWDEILDPKWKGKIVSASNLSFFQNLSKAIGPEQTFKLAEEFVKNQRPIFANGTGGAMQKLSAGEASLGLVTLSTIVEEQERGGPVAPVFTDPLPAIHRQMVVTIEGANHPNLARLWSAWLATEGFEISSKYGIAQAKPNKPGVFSKMITENNLKPLFYESYKDLETMDELGNRITKLVTTK